MIYLSSIDGLFGNPTFPAYSVSKGGLIPFTHVMAHDGAPHGIRVNAIAMAAMVPIGSADPEPLPIADGAGRRAPGDTAVAPGHSRRRGRRGGVPRLA